MTLWTTSGTTVIDYRQSGPGNQLDRFFVAVVDALAESSPAIATFVIMLRTGHLPVVGVNLIDALSQIASRESKVSADSAILPRPSPRCRWSQTDPDRMGDHKTGGVCECDAHSVHSDSGTVVQASAKRSSTPR